MWMTRRDSRPTWQPAVKLHYPGQQEELT
jgi:hypothetical protein